jgi:hypothetical protein
VFFTSARRFIMSSAIGGLSRKVGFDNQTLPESSDRESWAQFVNAMAGAANDIAQLATHTPTRARARGGDANGKSCRGHMRRGGRHVVKFQERSGSSDRNTKERIGATSQYMSAENGG